MAKAKRRVRFNPELRKQIMSIPIRKQVDWSDIPSRKKEDYSTTGIKYALILFGIVALFDLGSTLIFGYFGGSIFTKIEANIIFPFGGFFLIILGNILLVWLAYWSYTRLQTSSLKRFQWILILVIITVLRVGIVANNLSLFFDLHQDAVTVSQTQQISIPEARTYVGNTIEPLSWKEKLRTYFLLEAVIFIAYLPAFIAMYLFEKDHNISRKLKYKKVRRPVMTLEEL